MNGKTHFYIGVATGVSMVAYGALTSNPMFALGMITAPPGAMLPDIDHHNSKLGKAKNNVMSRLKLVSVLILAFSVLILCISVLGDYMKFAVNYCLIAIPISLSILIVESNFFKEKFKFLTKHRGIMHTLIIPIALICAGMNISTQNNSVALEWILAAVQSLVFGLAFGYISHIIADCITVQGCPIAFPISQEDVSFLPIRTGTVFEYIGAIVLSAAILAISILTAVQPKSLWLVVGVYMVAVGESIVNFTKTRGIKVIRLLNKKASFNPVCILVLLLMCIVGIFVCKRFEITVIMIGFSIGLIRGLFRR